MQSRLRRQAEGGSNYNPSPSPSVVTTLPSYTIAQNTDRLQGIVLPRYTNLPPYTE